MKKIQVLCIVAEILCVMAVGPGLGAYSFIYNECSLEGTDGYVGRIIRRVSLSLYALTLTTLYSLFAMRVYYSFVGTLCQLSPKTTKLLIAMFGVQITVNTIGVIVLGIDLQKGVFMIGIIIVELFTHHFAWLFEVVGVSVISCGATKPCLLNNLACLLVCEV